MNVYDSERMADALMPSGYMPTDAVEDADMVILNTCHIREKAAEKVYSDLGRLRGLKKRASNRTEICLSLWLAVWLRQKVPKLPDGRYGWI